MCIDHFISVYIKTQTCIIIYNLNRTNRFFMIILLKIMFFFFILEMLTKVITFRPLL